MDTEVLFKDNVVVKRNFIACNSLQEATNEQAVVHDDGIFTLTIGPSTSNNPETVNDGASGAVAVNVNVFFA